MTNDKKPSTESVKIEDPDRVAIVVAKENFPWGTKINPELLETKTFLKKSLPPGSFTEPAELVGRIVISSLQKGDPVVVHRLAPTDITVGGVSVVLDSGKRAIAVKGDQVIGISGFIKPGNRVDVLVTIKDPGKKKDITKIILENIPVLASGIQIQDTGTGEPSPFEVYTLEVTPEQGERLTLAATKGRLQFALRSIKDSDIVFTKGVTIEQMLASSELADEKTAEKVLPKAIKPPKKGVRKKYKQRKKQKKATVVTIKGLEITDKKKIQL
jgi:pilus assembly protein CpaB